MGLSVRFQEAQTAEWLLGSCDAKALQLKVIMVSRVFPGLCGPGWFLSFQVRVCVQFPETQDSCEWGWLDT